MEDSTSSILSNLHVNFVTEGQGASLAEQVAGKINQLIADRDLHSGDKLPNEFELANQLKVGRSTIREAVKILVARNCLEIKRGRGTFVKEYVDEKKDPLGLSHTEDQLVLAKDLIEVRMRIEPWMAALTAQRITKSEADKLQILCDEVKEKIMSGEDHFEADVHFHTYIGSCTHNQVMPELIHAITYCVAIFTKFREEELLNSTLETHQAIVDAIVSHDTMAAYKEMARHITYNIPPLHSIAVQQHRQDIIDALDLIKKNSIILL